MERKKVTRRAVLTQFGTALAVFAGPRPAMAQFQADYNIWPDSPNDQTDAIQRYLIDATRAKKLAILPAGRFKVSNLRLPEGCDLRGTANATTLVGNGDGPIVSARDISSASLSGLTIDARKSRLAQDSQGAVDFRNVQFINLTLLAVGNSANDGIYVERCAGFIQGCVISNAARFGIFSMQSAGLSITDNSVSKCGDGGIIVHRWENGGEPTTIERNTIAQIGATRGGTGQWGNGINTYQANGVKIRLNKINDCAFSAIRVNSGHDNEIIDNDCLRSGETAIYAEFAYRNVIITGNKIDGAANGISATNLNDGGRGARIMFNRIRNITAPGPYTPEAPYFGHGILAEADAIVESNQIENANGYGINIGWGPYLDNVSVLKNTIINAEIGIGVSSADGAGAAEIRGNFINARDGAIRSHQWDKIGADDLGIHPGDAPPNVQISDNIVN